MAVSGLPKLNDITNAISKAKVALSKYNTGKGSLKTLEEGISNLKTIQNNEYNKLKTLRADHENKTYLNVDSYNTARDTYNKTVDNYKKLSDYLKSGDVKNDDPDYKSAKSKYDSVYAIINSNRWYEESDAYKTALEKAGQANQKHNTARDWFDNNDYLKQNSSYQDLVKNLKSSEETYNRAKELANNENYLKDNSDYNNKNNTFNEAQNKLNDLDNWKNNGQYLRDHGGYQDALREIENKRNQLNEAENRLNNANDSNRNSLANEKVNAERAYEAAQANANKKREEADRDANTKVQNQGQARDNAEKELNRVKQEAEQKANTARENAERSYNEYREKEENTRNQLYDTAKNTVDTTKELRDSTQSEAEKAKDTARDVAQKAVDIAKTAMDGAENKAIEAYAPKLVAAREIADANGAKLGDLANTLSTAAYKDVEAQDKVVSQKDGLLQTAEKKYGDAVAAIEPDLQTYNAYAGDVVNYAKQFRENIGDIAGNTDVNAAKTLFDDFNKLITAGGFTDDITSKIKPYFDGIEFKGNFAVTPETIGGNYLDVKGSKLNNFGQREVMYQYTDALSGLVQKDLTNQWLLKNPGKTAKDIPIGIKQGIDYLSTHSGVNGLTFGSSTDPEAKPSKVSTYTISDIDKIKPVTVTGSGKYFTFDMSSPVVKLYNDVTQKLVAAEKTVGDPSKFKTAAEYDLAKLKEAGLWDNVFNDAGIVKLSQDSIKQVADKYAQYPEVDRFAGPLLSGYYDRISGYNNNQSVWDVINDANKKISANVDAAGFAAANKFETDQNAFYQANYGMSYDNYKKYEQAMFDKMQKDAFGTDSTEKAYDGVAKEFALKGGDPSRFSNLDPRTGLPILKQGVIDSSFVGNTSTITANPKDGSNIRDAITNSGWNAKSDSVSVARGAGIFGFNIEYQRGPGMSGQGGGLALTYNGSTQGATAALLKTAKELGLDPTDSKYIIPAQTVSMGVSGGMGSMGREQFKYIPAYFEPQTLYADINNKFKDVYAVSNVIGGDDSRNTNQPHATIVYKSDGNGNLVPLVDTQTNEPYVTYYQAPRLIIQDTGPLGGFLGPLLMIGSFIAAPYLSSSIASSLAGLQVSAAVAPTAFTVGLPAVTLGQTIGMTAVNALASGVTNSIMSGLTGGDLSDAGKAFVTGSAGSLASSTSNQILNTVGIDQSKIDAIAQATNTTPAQAANMIANTVTAGVVGTVLGDPNALEKAATNLAGQYVGSQAQNLVYDTIKTADPKVIASTVNAVGNVANVATQTTINGGDVSEALKNAMPSIISDAAQAGKAAEAAAKIPVTIVERSHYPDPLPDASDFVVLRPPNQIDTSSSTADPKINDLIKKAYTDPSVKVDVAQAMPVTAGDIQQLTRMAQSRAAQFIAEAATNDPLYLRSLATESAKRTFLQAGFTAIADTLTPIIAATSPGNLFQDTGENQIMEDKWKNELSKIANGSTNAFNPTDVAQLYIPGNVISPGESIDKYGQLKTQDGRNTGLYVDKSGTLYDIDGNPSVKNFVPPDVAPLVPPNKPSDPAVDPETEPPPPPKPKAPNFDPWKNPNTPVKPATPVPTPPVVPIPTPPVTEPGPAINPDGTPTTTPKPPVVEPVTPAPEPVNPPVVEPVTPTPEPVKTEPPVIRPVTPTPEPVTPTPEPVTPTPEPVIRPDGTPSPEIKPETETGTKPEIKPETETGTKPEIKPETETGIKPEIKPEGVIKPDLPPGPPPPPVVGPINPPVVEPVNPPTPETVKPPVVEPIKPPVVEPVTPVTPAPEPVKPPVTGPVTPVPVTPPTTPPETTESKLASASTAPIQPVSGTSSGTDTTGTTNKSTSPQWFDKFLTTSLVPSAYSSLFDPTKSTSFVGGNDDTSYLPWNEVMAMQPADNTASPLATLSTSPQQSNTQGALNMPASYYQYGDLSPMDAMPTATQTTTPNTPFTYSGATTTGALSMPQFTMAHGGGVPPTAALFAAKGGNIPHKGSHYVQGAGGGQDDLIDARLADGEYVFDADIVAAIGDGSNAEGARRLDEMRKAIRMHKRGAPNDKIPPKAKSPLAYLRGVK